MESRSGVAWGWKYREISWEGAQRSFLGGEDAVLTVVVITQMYATFFKILQIAQLQWVQ